jgi:hypothetical protein
VVSFLSFSAMMKSLLRISMVVLISVPLVAGLTLALFAVPSGVAAGVGIAGAGALTASEFVHNRLLAGVGGLLAFSGVLALALQAS